VTEGGPTLDPLALARSMMRLADEDKLVAIEWLERALSDGADDLDRGLLAGMVEGTFEFVVEHGELRWRLTEQGRTQADEIVANNPDAQRYLAELRKTTRVDGPKEPQ